MPDDFEDIFNGDSDELEAIDDHDGDADEAAFDEEPDAELDEDGLPVIRQTSADDDDDEDNAFDEDESEADETEDTDEEDGGEDGGSDEDESDGGEGKGGSADAGDAGDNVLGPEDETPFIPEDDPDWNAIAGSMSPDDLPEDFTLNGETINLKAAAEDFPEAMALAIHLSRQIAQKALEAYAPALKQFAASYNSNMYWNKVESLSPGAYDAAATSEFQTWLKEQPKQIQDIAAAPDPKGAAYVVDLYKKLTGAGEQDEEPEGKSKGNAKVRERRKIKGTMRAAKGSPRKSARTTVTYEDAFNEDD